MSGLNNQCNTGGLSAPLDAADIADGSVSNIEFETLDGVTGAIQTTTLADGKIWIGNAGAVATAVTPSGDFTITNLGVSAISSNVIVNADVKSDAAIDYSKLATLTSGNILVGSAGNVPTSVSMSGDVAIVASGATTIQNSSVTNAKMANMADQRIKGNTSGGAAAPSDLTPTEVTAMLNVMTGAGGTGLKGLVPSQVAGDATKFLKGDGTWGTVTGGDVVGPASSTDNGFVKFDGTTGKLIKNSAATITNTDIAAAAGIAVNKLAALSASIVPITDGSGFLSSSSVTPTTLAFLDATSSVQTQIDTKQARSTLTTKGDLYVATASATVARQAAGTNHYVLRANSGVTNGIEYALPLNASNGIINLGLTTSVSSNALTIAVKTSASSDASATDPIFVGFRSSTQTSGAFSMVSITGSLSLVISSGSTLGQRDGIESTIYVYLINNAGTAELAVSRSRVWDESSLVSTTAEGGAGAADSASAVYSATARSNVAIKLIGKIVNTQTTAGTWASAGSEVSVLPFNILPLACQVSKTSSQNPGTTALTKTNWDSIASADGGGDPWGFVDLTNERIVSPRPGPAIIYVDLSLANFEASTSLQVYLYRSGSVLKRWDVDNAGVGTTRDAQFVYIDMDCAKDSYYEVFTQSGADSSYAIIGNSGVSDSRSVFGAHFLT